MLYLALIICILLVLALSWLLFMRVSENKRITAQMRELTGKDSNTLIHTGYSTESIRALVGEINRLYEKLRRQEIAMLRKSERLDMMLANISHDLRTPLTSALGYIDMINRSLQKEAAAFPVSGEEAVMPEEAEKGTAEIRFSVENTGAMLSEKTCVYQASNGLASSGKDGVSLLENASENHISESEIRQELEIVEKRLHRLSELIDAFFEFSKIISSEKEPEKEELSLNAVLEESIVHYYDDYNDRNRKIIFENAIGRTKILSNRNMLLRIFDNLIGNALKHGIGDLTVRLENSDGIKISFSNGVLDENIDTVHIFDEFYTKDISRTGGNTGLGLAIAKEFTELLGGRIAAEVIGGQLVIRITVEFRLQSLPKTILELIIPEK